MPAEKDAYIRILFLYLCAEYLFKHEKNNISPRAVNGLLFM